MVACHFCHSSRGRGTYRGRGRGNYFRQDRNSTHQHHHQHQTAPGQPHSNVPYYDQSMNVMNTNMTGSGGGGGGQGGYNDGVYHDAQMNRYDRIYIFSKNDSLNQSFTINAFYKINNIDQMHSIQCISISLYSI